MPTCERCWDDSMTIEEYKRLVSERDCTPEQQAGPGAHHCAACGRRAVHQHCHICIACGKQLGAHMDKDTREAPTLSEEIGHIRNALGRLLEDILDTGVYGVPSKDKGRLVRHLVDADEALHRAEKM